MKIVTPADDFSRFYVSDEELKKDGRTPEMIANRTKYLVEKTIADYESNQKKKVKDRVEEYAERADALSTYLKHLVYKGGTDGGAKPLEKYFGKRMLAHLRGEEIRERIMEQLAIRNQQGRLIKAPGQIIG